MLVRGKYNFGRQRPEARAKAQMPGAPAYDSLHSLWGTNLYRLGVPEKIIQAILGHANVSTTNTYDIKTAAADTQAAMARLKAPNGQ